MKKELSPQTIIGVIAVAVVVLGIVSWIYLRPKEDVAKPHMQQLGGGQSRLNLIKRGAANPPASP